MSIQEPIVQESASADPQAPTTAAPTTAAPTTAASMNTAPTNGPVPSPEPSEPSPGNVAPVTVDLTADDDDAPQPGNVAPPIESDGDEDSPQVGNDLRNDGHVAVATAGGELSEPGQPGKKRKRRRKKKSQGANAQGEGGASLEGEDKGNSHGDEIRHDARAHERRGKKPPRFDRERSAFTVGDVVFGKIVEITEEAIFVDLSGKGTAIFDRREMALPEDPNAVDPVAEVAQADGKEAIASEPVAVADEVDGLAALNGSAAGELVAVADEALANADTAVAIVVDAPTADTVESNASAEISEMTPALAGSPYEARIPVDQVPPIVLEEGAHFVAIVHNDGARGGLVVLTRHPRRVHRAKERVEKACNEKTPVEGLVTGIIKGGVEIDVAGLRAFCPASHMTLRLGADLTKFVGQRLEFDVAQYAAKGHNVVLSRKNILETEATAAKEIALARIRPLVGQSVEGIVRSVVAFGAFIDLGDVEGLVPLTEMSHNRSDQPADVFKVGEMVQVQIQKVDDRGKIWLSRKALLTDPWASVAQKFKSGTRHTGKIVRMQPFGVFVELEPGVDGLIRSSDLVINNRPETFRRFESPSEFLKVGDELEVVVSHVEPGAHRISLHPALVAEAAEEPTQRVQQYKSVKAVIHTIEASSLQVRLLGVTGCNARGFVPASATGTARGTELRKAFKVGQVLEGKIMEIDHRGGEVKLSVRALSDDQERSAYKTYRDQVSRDSRFTFGDMLAKKGIGKPGA